MLKPIGHGVDPIGSGRSSSLAKAGELVLDRASSHSTGSRLVCRASGRPRFEMNFAAQWAEQRRKHVSEIPRPTASAIGRAKSLPLVILALASGLLTLPGPGLCQALLGAFAGQPWCFHPASFVAFLGLLLLVG